MNTACHAAKHLARNVSFARARFLLKGRRPLLLAHLLVLVISLGRIHAQATNEIIDVDPDTAGQGTTGLLITFTLDTDSPPAPPAGVMPNSVMIGMRSGTSVTHASQYSMTAIFNIPADETVGPKDASITFPTPGGTLTFAMAGAFTVTAADTPPGILQHPIARTVAPGGAVTFTVSAAGTEPLTYQWQKDSIDIPAAGGTSYTINPVAETDAGSYRCVVTNDFGMVTSNEAVLTVAIWPIGSYPIVDTGQVTCYDEAAAIACPPGGAAFHGQDAQYSGHAPSYVLSGDGLCVIDQVTGLTWQRSPDMTRNSVIDADDKLTWAQVQAYPATLNAESFGGYDDWRVPTIKELYSLIDLRGTDPSVCATEAQCSNLKPFIDTNYFNFAYGDTAAGERVIDAQYASSTLYVSTVDDDLLFGVNFADGRIKGYGLTIMGTDKSFFLICVRGNAYYGINNLADNGDGTMTDRATGLMWTQADSGSGMFWEDALQYAEDLVFAGHDDWRLPSVKELQSILDYTRAPDTTSSAAIDPLFDVTPITNEEEQADYPYYWSATTHVQYTGTADAGAYVAFGRGLGYLDGEWRDVHGAGCQRSDPKTGDPADYPTGHGPQGDAIRIYNYVRCVRTVVCPGDYDGDGDVDGDDVDAFGDCATGPAVTLASGCETRDFDGDSDVDQFDFARLQRCISGENVAADSDCAD